MKPLIAMDANKIREAVKAGLTAEMVRQLARYGVVFDSRLGAIGFLKDDPAAIELRENQDGTLACDAQPELVTVNNAGIPAYLTNFVDPRILQIAVSPMKATQIVGSEEKKGDWTTTHAQFMSVELTGETSAYGDHNNNGSTNANANFPVRQSFYYQTFTSWGEQQLAKAGLARIDYASQVNAASVLVLNKFQNASYFFGVDNIPNYGLLNDPSLYAPIAATAPWNASSTDALVVYEDVRRMFVQLQNQSNGVIEMDAEMTLAMSPVLSVALNKANQFAVNVKKLLADNFPNLKIETAVEYETASGQLVQLICRNVQGQQTATTAYNEKMRAHAVVVESSSWKQKKSQGTFGTIIFNPYAIVGLIGA